MYAKIIGAAELPLPTSSPRSTNILMATFGLAVVIRLAYLGSLQGDASFFAEPDTAIYWALSERVREAIVSTTDRLPLYPMFLAACRYLFGNSPRLVAFVQAILDAGTCAMIARLALFISRPTGIAAGVLSACSATLIVYSAQMLTDSFALFVLTAVFLAIALFLARPSIGLASGSGLLAGMALVTRPAVALLLPVMAAIIFGSTLPNMRRGVGFAVTFSIFAALPIAPIILRNEIYFHTLALTSQSGEHMLIWIAPMLRQRQDGTPFEASVKENYSKFDTLVGKNPSAYFNPFARSSLMSSIAISELGSIRPATFIKAWIDGAAVNLIAPAALADPRVRLMQKPSFFGTPGRTLIERSALYLTSSSVAFASIFILSSAGSALAFILAAMGFVWLIRHRPTIAALAAIPVVYFLFINGPVGAAKYRMPMEPSLIVLAAVGVASSLPERRCLSQWGERSPSPK